MKDPGAEEPRCGQPSIEAESTDEPGALPLTRLAFDVCHMRFSIRWQPRKPNQTKPSQHAASPPITQLGNPSELTASQAECSPGVMSLGSLHSAQMPEGSW